MNKRKVLQSIFLMAIVAIIVAVAAESIFTVANASTFSFRRITTTTISYHHTTTTSSSTTTTSSTTSTTTILPSTSTVKVTITNYQSVSTPTNFQQMIKFNPSTYAGYENLDLGNIRFYYGDTELYSWCESGCSNSSTNTIFWVKLPVQIKAKSDIKVSMIFQSKSTNYDGNYAGEAPQLSDTYAQYDNGVKVFNLYDNFAGTSLPSNLYIQNPSGSYSVNNGLTILGSGSWEVIQTTSTYNPETTTVDVYTYSTDFATGGIWHVIGWDSPQVALGNDPFTSSYDLYNYNGIATYVDISGGSTTAYSLWSLWLSPTASFLSIGYGKPVSNSGSFNAVTSNKFDFATSTGNTYVQWVKFRISPPNDIMPSISFGPVTK